MAQPVIMPRQGQSVESCILTRWHKQQGDAVFAGDMLFTYETDKATFDESAAVDGVLLAVYYEEGDDVPCLETVCVVGAATEKYEGSAGKVSPRARKLAERAGIDPSQTHGTGPGGRIIERDINALLANAEPINPQTDTSIDWAAQPIAPSKGKTAAPRSDKAVFGNRTATPPDEYIRHPLIRKRIAQAMHASLSTLAQLTLHASFDASDIVAWRARLKEKGESLGLPGITLGDIILYAVSRVLPKHRYINAHFDDEGIRLFSSVHLGVAVDTERGLMVPTVFDADSRSLGQISEEVKRLASACRGGGVNPDELTGGTFTVTNLGASGIEMFTPVINPPQTAILGVCGIVERPRATGGQISLYPAMGLSLTFDHRAVDGAPAAKFLADLREYLENFSLQIAF